MNEIKFVQVTPEQLKLEILEGIKQQLQELKENFEPKSPVELLTRKETKDLLKIDLSTLTHYTKDGKLQSYGIGNRVFYKRSEVEQALIKIIH